MPQLQSLVLKDRTTPTPVDHTFTPVNIDPKTGVAALGETNGVPVGNNRYTISRRKNGNGKYKITALLAMPVVQTQDIGGIQTPIEVRTAYAQVEFTFDQTSTAIERANAVGMLADSLAAAKWTNSVFVNLEGVY